MSFHSIRDQGIGFIRLTEPDPKSDLEEALELIARLQEQSATYKQLYLDVRDRCLKITQELEKVTCERDEAMKLATAGAGYPAMFRQSGPVVIYGGGGGKA